MGEIAKLIIKVGLVVALVASSAGIIALVFGVDWSGYSDSLSAIQSSYIWAYLINGIALGKWIFGSVPIVGIVSVGVAFLAFSITGRFVDFVRRTFFN